jgi:hypothetical protein
MTKDVLDYLYKKYRTAMKPLDMEIMPRRVFVVLMSDAHTLIEGEAILEKFIEQMMMQVIEQFKKSLELNLDDSEEPNDTSDIGEPVRSES